MKTFIFINGPMGVGKTTTGKRICDKLGRAGFIDGDWCMDIHPFIGNQETIAMAIDNIVHMIRNYYVCSECDTIVLGWIANEQTTNKIIGQISTLNIQIHNIILNCSRDALINRWKKDTITEWRSDERWLNQSLNSLDNFKLRSDAAIIDTSELSEELVADKIIEMTIVPRGESFECERIGTLET